MAHHKKNTSYFPRQRVNPIVLSKRIDKLQEELEHHQNLLLAVNKANDLHVEQLSNFVRHDMKNAIQGIDGTLYNARKSNLIPHNIQAELDTALGLLRGSLDSFTRLIPSSRKTTTTLPEVLNAVEMLSRSELLKQSIDATFDYDRQSELPIHYSFQSLVQVLHNLVINAYNAFMDQAEKKLLLKGTIEASCCRLCLYDNGIPIEPARREIIFKYGYSTTGGSGIGLFHARSVITEMNGIISLVDSDMSEYTKCFVIEFNPQKSSI